jgi:hypothetical protein
VCPPTHGLGVNTLMSSEHYDVNIICILMECFFVTKTIVLMGKLWFRSVQEKLPINFQSYHFDRKIMVQMFFERGANQSHTLCFNMLL